MRKLLVSIVGATLAVGLISGCIIHTRSRCRTDCYWSHGRKVCEQRCN